MGQHTITKGAQCLQLGACVWQSPCGNTCSSEIAAAMIIFIRAGSGIIPIRLIVFVGIQSMFFHVSPHSFFGVIGVDFIRITSTNV